jgi:hypothetical protein
MARGGTDRVETGPLLREGNHCLGCAFGIELPSERTAVKQALSKVASLRWATFIAILSI